MQYLCLICAEQMMEHLDEADAARHFGEYAVFTYGIKRSGHFIAANRLTPPGMARTLRVRDGKVRIVDGPFAETKEAIGGYYLIEAQDFDEALRIAAKIPGAQRGCVEVRPVATDAQTRALWSDNAATLP